VVVNASGPFQGSSYLVAAACISARAHYIDLADAREFVSGISRLHDAARAAGVAVISGASSVPALSSAAADALAGGFSTLDRIDIGISPGNRTERGLSTVRAILGHCGKPLPGSGGLKRFGWSGSWRFDYPLPVGRRLLSPCDVPDLVLFPQRYPGRPQVRFGAGLELAFLHRGMNFMALLVRLRLVRDWSRYAPLLNRIADHFRSFGTDDGAMHVSVTGQKPDGTRDTLTWLLLATRGDGPYVPTLAATALVRKLAAGNFATIGAMPCLGLLTLKDFEAEMQDLCISMYEQSRSAS
jgi:hypothetical protein